MSVLFGVLGHPVAHSLSPTMHRVWLAAAGIDGDYVAIDLGPGACALDVLEVFQERGLSGANLTVPLKTEILDHLDVLEPTGARVGAVNTLVLQDGRLIGSNTDAAGFLAEARAIAADRSMPAVVLGAGGAGRAVVAGLLDDGYPQITVLNRSAERTRALREAFDDPRVKIGALEDLPGVAGHAGLIACCVSGPGADRIAQLDVSSVRANAAWIDLNYWQARPPHLTSLTARGVRTSRGLVMLAHQGALAFRAFTGVAVDPTLALAILTREAEHRRSGR